MLDKVFRYQPFQADPRLHGLVVLPSPHVGLSLPVIQAEPSSSAFQARPVPPLFRQSRLALVIELSMRWICVVEDHSLARRAQLIQWTNNPIAPGKMSPVVTTS